MSVICMEKPLDRPQVAGAGLVHGGRFIVFGKLTILARLRYRNLAPLDLALGNHKTGLPTAIVQRRARKTNSLPAGGSPSRSSLGWYLRAWEYGQPPISGHLCRHPEGKGYESRSLPQPNRAAPGHALPSSERATDAISR